MNDTHASERQVRHLLDRARYNVICFFLVHFNARELKRSSEPAVTCAIPVHPDFELWRQLLTSEKRSISRTEAEMYGYPIEWNILVDVASRFKRSRLGHVCFASAKGIRFASIAIGSKSRVL